MAVSVSFEGINKFFDGFHALKDVSLTIGAGELFFLLGPSGCGKTTLLRCLAGFHTPESGRIRMDGRDITALPPHKRDTGMMFQSYALWPHLTLAENVAFGLEMRRVPKPEIKRRVLEALDMVHLADRAQAKPNQLSGGQQQRVALARALVIDPLCLLLDEPLSNLDAKLRLEMRAEIRRICKERGLTAIYVTHDQKEALSIADRLAVMRGGVVEQVGTPSAVYRSPANRFVAEFMGEGNFLDGEVETVAGAGGTVRTPQGLFAVEKLPAGAKAGTRATLCIRPEAVCFSDARSGAPNCFSATLKESVYLGEVAQHELVLPDSGFPFKAYELNPLPGQTRPGSTVSIRIPPEQVIALPRV